MRYLSLTYDRHFVSVQTYLFLILDDFLVLDLTFNFPLEIKIKKWVKGLVISVALLPYPPTFFFLWTNSLVSSIRGLNVTGYNVSILIHPLYLRGIF